MANDVLERISDLVEPSLRQCGVELYEAQWDARGAEPVLRLLIEKSGGISLDDCERVSHAVSAVLDAHDPIEGSTPYHLEVSSPGAERPLRRPRDWERALGMRVNVRFRSGETTTVVEGRLLAVSDQSVEVEVREGRALRAISIPVADIAGARRAVDI